MRFAKLLSLVATAPMLIGASQPLRLQPSSQWNVDYAENSCRLSRAFGEGDGATILSLESEVPGQADMFVIGKQIKTNYSEVFGRFLPGQKKPKKGEVVQSPHGTAILWKHADLFSDETIERIMAKAKAMGFRRGVRPPPIDLAEKAQLEAEREAFAAKVVALEIGPRGMPLILDTGSLGAAIKAFDKCSRDSLRDWGIDPAIEEKIVRRPWSPDVYKWFTSSDYPPSMVVQGQQADVKVRLLVDATGKVTRCTSLSHFKEKSFNDVVCSKFMTRARFQPAELADGTKVPSFYWNHVVFRVP